MQRFDRGFSFIELVLVVALISLLGLATGPFFSNFLSFNNFDTSWNTVEGAVRKAQANSMNRYQNQTWGVCIAGTNVRVYTGSCNSPTFSQDTALNTNITVTGLTGVTFNIKGEPSAATSILISNPLESKTMTINTAGRISGP